MNKEWFKHWFVLRNNSLTYFRDPSAEDSGILDGVLDLGLIKSITSINSERYCAFSIMVSATYASMSSDGFVGGSFSIDQLSA